MKLLFLTLVFALCNLANAQTGTLAGKVTHNNSPVPSVNIIVINSGLGIGSDINGSYRIENIPAGSYDVKFSSVGYKTKTF